MIVSDKAIEALERGEATDQYDVAVKTEPLNGKDFFFVGFDEMWVWRSLLATANPELQQNILEAIRRYCALSK